MPFVPRRVYFEEEALNYPLGKKIWEIFKDDTAIEMQILKAKQRITNIPGASPAEAYNEGKRTLVVGVRKTLDFQGCKPSAHFQLPLVTGCMGRCEYCYLNTQFGKKPYVRLYVNLEEILSQVAQYIYQRKPELTLFEGAATSDPVPVEPYTGALAKTIKFFSKTEHGRFRFVTKFTDIESLLGINHRYHTTIRFSINAQPIVENYEHFAPSLDKRLEAARKVIGAEYPVGFIIGPVILFDGWQGQYEKMLNQLQNYLKDGAQGSVSFEVISHRFTSRAKNVILNIYPNSTLPMDEDTRKYKFGQFGYGKYIYPPEQIAVINAFFTQGLKERFPNSPIDYII